MEIKLVTSLKQIQTLSPQFIQSQQLLQMPVIELVQEIQKELSENPALEIENIVTCPHCGRPMNGTRCEHCGRKDNLEEEQTEQFIQQRIMEYDGDSAPYEGPIGEREDATSFTSFTSRETSFRDYLTLNFLASEYPEGTKELGEFLVHSISEDGFLTYDETAIADMFETTPEVIDEVVKVIQTLEPAGVGARDAREALLIQLNVLAEEGKGCELAERIIDQHFENLGKNRYERIATELEVPVSRVRETLDFIRRNLNPYPGRAYMGRSTDAVQLAKPAIEIRYDGKALSYEVLELADFRLRINSTYLDMYRSYKQGNTEITRKDMSHVREYFRRAKFYQDSIEQRKQTLDKIAKAICEEQAEFLIKGLPNFNTELTQGRLAEKIELHESTVSRAMSGKFIRVPSGEIFSFDFFFDSSIRPKEYIKNLIFNEDAKKPISDNRIRDILLEKGIKLARRTVAKYREELRIPSSYERRRA